MKGKKIRLYDPKKEAEKTKKVNLTFEDKQHSLEDFKQRIKNPEFANYSLIAVAFESGFSSKSSFNTIFKKYTGTTPSEYRKQSAS